MIVVYDTNVLVSGMLFGRGPRRLVDAAIQGRVTLATSNHQLEELARVLTYPKLARHVADAHALVELVGQMAIVVEPAPSRLVCRDPDDDHILAIALTVGADVLVSGDDDLLALGGEWEGTKVVGVAEALELVDGAT